MPTEEELTSELEETKKSLAAIKEELEKAKASTKTVDLEKELEETKAALKAANKESAARRIELKELKEKDDSEKSELEKLQDKFDALNAEHETLKAEKDNLVSTYEAEKKQRTIQDAAMARASELGFEHPKDALALIDLSKAEIAEGGEVTGFSEALEELAEQKRLPMKVEIKPIRGTIIPNRQQPITKPDTEQPKIPDRLVKL